MFWILQLRNHFLRVPIRPDILDFALAVYFEDIDTFKLYFLAMNAGSLPGPLHRRAVAGHENRIFFEQDALKVLANRFKEFADAGAAGDRRRAEGIAGGAVFRKRVGKSLGIHGANGQEVSAD